MVRSAAGLAQPLHVSFQIAQGRTKAGDARFDRLALAWRKAANRLRASAMNMGV